MPILPDDVAEFDPLRVSVNGLKRCEESALRARLLESVLDSLAGMNVWRLQSVAQFIDLCGGCETPVGSFIDTLMMRHYLCGGLTPDLVMAQLDPENPDGFRWNFENFIEQVRRFNAEYPKREPASASASILRRDVAG